MKQHTIEYAVYDGDTLVAIGTVPELAKELQVKESTIYFMCSKKHHERAGSTGRVVIMIEDELDVYYVIKNDPELGDFIYLNYFTKTDKFYFNSKIDCSIVQTKFTLEEIERIGNRMFIDDCRVEKVND